MTESKLYVCETCIEDPALQAVVREHVVSEVCDYCLRTADHPVACEIGDIVERVRFAIYQEYASPEEETMYDPEEGDYAGRVLEHMDVFDEIGFQLANEELREDIVGYFWDERFCTIGMWPGSPGERQMDAWEGFKSIVKHRRRYTFWNTPEDECDHGITEHPPSEMLQHIADTIGTFDLTVSLPQATRIWRVRVHDAGRRLTLPNELTAPRPEQAKYANRMSPAGVPMFYGADDYETAWKETVNPEDIDGKELTGGVFETLAPMNVLDLHRLPIMESFFSDWKTGQREGLQFLRAFQTDISQPIKKDGRQHIEYVPTQVFTEYIRFESRAPEGAAFNGIRYPSSRTGRPCIVLFSEQDDCLPDVEYRKKPQVLRLDPASVVPNIDLAELWRGSHR